MEETNRPFFLRLPAELRLCIYRCVLGSLTVPCRTPRQEFSDGIVLDLWVFGLKDKSPRTYSAQKIALPNGKSLWTYHGLVLSCHKIYAEIEHELLRLHSKLFDSIRGECQRHKMAVEFSPLSCLKDTNEIMIGMPCSRIVRNLDKLKGAMWTAMHQVALGDLAVLPGFDIDPAFEYLIISLFDSLLSFSLYLTSTGTEICGFETENNLHHLMFDTFVEHLAGRGQTYQCDPFVNGQLVTPRGTSPLWGVYTKSKVEHWPQLLQYEYKF